MAALMVPLKITQMQSVRDWAYPTFHANSVTRVILADYISVTANKRVICKADNVKISARMFLSTVLKAPNSAFYEMLKILHFTYKILPRNWFTLIIIIIIIMHVEYKNKGDTSNNSGNWDYFKVI